MKIVSSKEIYSCGLFRVTEDEAVEPDRKDKPGWTIRRNVVRHNGSAVVMPVDSKNRVMLVRQYRLPADKYLWELPAGKIDDGENALRAAKRELIEETGLRAGKWKKLARFYPSPGFLQETMTIYLATDLTQGEAQPMEDERIETKWFRRRELREMLRANAIVDAKTMIGFLYWDRL
jgi:ADP-ribose diphosphatase